MKFIKRRYQSEDDYWRIRAFLGEVTLLNQGHMFSWPIMRWDYWCFHGILNLGDGSLERDVTIWETAEDQIVAVLNREEAGHAFLQVHPAYKTEKLEEEMITCAEENLVNTQYRGGPRLWVWSDSEDSQKQAILQIRGYQPFLAWSESQWVRDLAQPIPELRVCDGYTIRKLNNATDLPSRCWASWRAFHSNEPDEKYDPDCSWYLNIQRAPMYRPELDLVAMASSGEVVAFTTVWFEEATQCGYFEPVGTVPEHQRRGLARCLLLEGMQRLRSLGATKVIVSGYNPPANALYKSVLGPVFDTSIPWEKRWE